jgi:hypothetical protein
MGRLRSLLAGILIGLLIGLVLLFGIDLIALGPTRAGKAPRIDMIWAPRWAA